MTLLPNGRPATQSDIASLREHLDKRLDRFEGRLDEHGSRIRDLELERAEEDGEDRATAAARSAERTVRRDSISSRRWRVGIAIGVISIFLTNMLSLAALIK